MRTAAFGLTALSGVLVLAGFGGALHPAADTLALLRPPLALVTLAGAFVVTGWRSRLGFAAIALVALTTVAPSLLPRPAGGDIRIYSKNLWAPNSDPSAVVADIAVAEVDAVFLQEVSRWNGQILDLLKPEFPHQKLCRFSGWSGVAIASRHPFDGPARCSAEQALAAAPVQIDGTRIWLVSAHIPWPWPSHSRENELAAEALIAGLDAPTVIAGDFNSFPWTRRLHRIASLSGTKPAGPVRASLFVRHVPLPIDQAFAPGGGALELRPKLGSDHYGIIADLALTP